MIILEEVAKKLSAILNKTDNEVNASAVPFDYQFLVETEGFYLDSIADKKTGNNVIPVFVSQVGGSFDAVPKLKRGILNVRVDFWFPVCFKKDFYTLNGFLVDVFVAQFLNFGAVSGKCLCNVSPFEVGEIAQADFKQFEEFMGNQYKLAVDKMATYMNMSFTLYLTNCDSSFIYGNNLKYKLSFSRKEEAIGVRPTDVPPGILPPPEIFARKPDKDKFIPGPPQINYYAYQSVDDGTVLYVNVPFEDIDNYTQLYEWDSGLFPVASSRVLVGKDMEDVYYEEELVWTASGTGLSNSPMSQQLVDGLPYAENVSNIITYQKSIMAYIRNTDFWKIILEYYNDNRFNELENWQLSKTYEIGDNEETYIRNQIALTINENIALGELLTMTISFGDKQE